MNELTVDDVMSKDVVSVGEEDDLATVYDIMEHEGFRHIPVADEEGGILGLVSQRDLVRSGLFATDSLTLDTLYDFLRLRRVNEIMVRDPATVSADQPLDEAADLLLENKFGCLPVVEGSRLVGILTEADFVRHLRDRIRSERSGRAA